MSMVTHVTTCQISWEGPCIFGFVDRGSFPDIFDNSKFFFSHLERIFECLHGLHCTVDFEMIAFQRKPDGIQTRVSMDIKSRYDVSACSIYFCLQSQIKRQQVDQATSSAWQLFYCTPNRTFYPLQPPPIFIQKLKARASWKIQGTSRLETVFQWLHMCIYGFTNIHTYIHT